MPILLQSNHALSFDGVTDGVIMPQGTHSKLGYEHDATNSNLRNVGDIVGGSSKGGKGKSIITGLFPTKIAIEAWVVPDCGGVIISKEGQFQLSIGTVDTPGPATFEAFIQTPTGQEKVFLRSALPTATGYDGQVYPPFTYGGIDDSYNRFAGSKDDATSLNINQRPLYHIVASFENNIAKLYINGDLVCKQTINKDYTLIENSNHIYLGGKGGEFRGVIESIHITTGVSKQMIDRSAPLVENSTVALFRFEEPISPFFRYLYNNCYS